MALDRDSFGGKMQVKNNKLIYQDKPRLKTALEMLRTSMNLEDSLHEVNSLLIHFFLGVISPLTKIT